jgi:hypothetical protein
LQPSEPKVVLQVLWQSEDSIRVTPFKEGSVVESTIKTSRTCHFHSGMVSERAREVLSILARANAGAMDLLPELVGAGQDIWTDLLPDVLREKFESAHSRNLVLHLDRQLLGIPWELLHDGDEFLGRRFRIGRLVSVDAARGDVMPRSMTGPLDVLIIADPCGDLPAARREAAEVEAVLEQAACMGRVTVLSSKVSVRALRDELPKHDVLHFAGHADHMEGKGETRLRLCDGHLPVRMLDQLRGKVTFPGLVFLNACGSSDASQALAAGLDPLGQASGTAASFLMAGTRHVVATLWEVRDEVAREFALAFYQALGRGETVGASMESGRSAVTTRHGAERLLWAAHLLYGDPTWAAAPAANLNFDDFDVLDGLEARHREELMSADGPTRLRAAAMLLRLGDRTVGPALRRDLGLLEKWLSPHATRAETRQAAFVVRALASATGLAPAGDAETLPDAAAVRQLLDRLGSA